MKIFNDRGQKKKKKKKKSGIDISVIISGQLGYYAIEEDTKQVETVEWNLDYWIKIENMKYNFFIWDFVFEKNVGF